MKTPKSLIFALTALSLILSVEARACFNPRTEPSIAAALTPNRAYHENAMTIEQIHRYIWTYRRQIDPRLVYHRLVGESGGDPFIVNRRSGAYGLFQFLGSPYRSPRTHRQLIEERYRQHPGVSPRLIQVEYYLSEYMQTAKRAADGGYGCNPRKNFSEYTNLEKVSYLGWGSCTQAAMRQELALCTTVASYRDGSCEFSQEVIRGGDAEPLCDM